MFIYLSLRVKHGYASCPGTDPQKTPAIFQHIQYIITTDCIRIILLVCKMFKLTRIVIVLIQASTIGANPELIPGVLVNAHDFVMAKAVHIGTVSEQTELIDIFAPVIYIARKGTNPHISFRVSVNRPH